MKGNTKICKLSELQLVEESLKRCDHHLMTDCSIEANSGTYSESSVLILVIKYTYIHGGVMRWGKNLLQGTVNIRWKTKASGKVIAGSKRNISECYLIEIYDSVDHFIQSTIASQYNDRMGCAIGGKIMNQSGSMMLVFSK